MPDILIDGDFTMAQPVGPARTRYPFRKFGDRGAAIVEQDYWQLAATFTPQEFPIPHPTIPGYWSVAESDPIPLGITDTIVTFTRTFACVPGQQVVEGLSFNFTAPNFTPVPFLGTEPPANSYAVVGSYAVFAVGNYGTVVSTAVLQAVTGYYGAVVAITGYSGTPATQITAAGNGCQNGDRLLYRRGNSWLYFDVASGGGTSTLTGTSTSITSTSQVLGTRLLAQILTADDNLRRQTRLGTDYGQTVNLPARTIEDYYLPGVTPGIATGADIPAVQPYQLENYLAAWAGAADWFNVAASNQERWNDWPILKRAYTQAKLAPLA